MFYPSVFHLFITTLTFCRVTCQNFNDIQRLFKDKVLSNNPYIRPVENQSSIVNVSLSFNLISINSFDEVLEKLSFTAWMNIWWTDEFVTWDKHQYGQTDSIWPPDDKIWKPQIAVKNTVNELRHLSESNSIVKITSDGLVKWSPGSAFETHCEVDTSNYPFDRQMCRVEIIVWGCGLELVDLHPASTRAGLNLYLENGEWVITSTSVTRLVLVPHTSEYPVLIVSLHLRRRSVFIVISVVLPASVLAILSVFVFAIPFTSGDKISFSVTILLAFGVLMNFIMDTLPKTSKHISLLVLYLVTNTTIGAVFVSLTILLTNLYHWNEQVRPVPKRLLAATKCLQYVFRLKIKLIGTENSGVQSVLNVNGLSKHGDDWFKKAEAEDVATWKDVANTLDAVLFRICFPAMLLFFTAFVAVLYTNSY